MTAAAWRSRYGGVRWRVTDRGVELDEVGRLLIDTRDGILRTHGEPITARRLLRAWGRDLVDVATATGVPVAILAMTVLTEGNLRWKGEGFSYAAFRKEPGYRSDDLTPHKISIGPTHILLSNFRHVLRDRKASSVDATDRRRNLLAAGIFMADRRSLHDYDPILVAASYNAGGLYDSSNPDSQYHNPWHLRAYDHDGPEGPAPDHLTRAARWYGDIVHVLRHEDPLPPAAPVLAGR